MHHSSLPVKAIRRRFAVLSLASLAALATPLASAQAPAGPIRILVGFPAGGTIDVVTRQVAEEMHHILNVSIVVESLPGAGGQLAAQQLKRAAPDGRTLMVAPDHTAVTLPLTVARPGFNVQTDFVPVGTVANYAGAIAVSSASGIQDMKQWMERVRKDVEGGQVGTSAPGSLPQFLLTAFAQQHKVKLNAVPYRGSVPMVQDLAGGHLEAGITALGDFLEFHRAGKLRIIAVTGDSRANLLPQVPTTAEAGFALRMGFWIGMFAPAGTPPGTIGQLNQALNQALAKPAVRERMTALVFEPAPTTPVALRDRIGQETQTLAPLVQASGWVKQ